MYFDMPSYKSLNKGYKNVWGLEIEISSPHKHYLGLISNFRNYSAKE